ncbi:MAG: prephenate dehydratase [Candidatus Bipolaricaulota bacterium]|nr:prephenate dehydratase [Candidatus Bipolaricaulota bacterium]MBS3791386.1 prephenate dehydratase [Candidatus Bipolaricaulota bacterium]
MSGEIMRVAFQGEPGAYSEQALHKYFEEEGIRVEGVPCESLEDVILEVESGKAPGGIIPVENSIGGYVDRSYKLISQGNVYVNGEVYLRVRHSLLAIDGADLSQVDTVYSHPQALKQCREFLFDLEVETRATYDTAGSAKMVKKKKDPRLAAIASKFAGEKYGLKVLMEDIQTAGNNHTRFLLVSRETRSERMACENYKTTITFELGDGAGSLYECLAPFAEKDINLTMIQSRPTETGRWEYHFDLELEGHRKDVPVNSAIAELNQLVPEVQVLGSYPRGKVS